jgi:hypothetical protein
VRPAAALLADNVVIELGMQDLRSNSREQVLAKFTGHDIPIGRLVAQEGPLGPFTLPPGSRIAQVRSRVDVAVSFARHHVVWRAL